MNKNNDKPIFLDVKSVDLNDKDSEAKYIDEIKCLCNDQLFAVLATYGTDDALASLIAFAASDEIKEIVFLTPKNTTKYNHILENNHIAILIDNRSDHPESINQISALTLSGAATIVNDEADRVKWIDLFLKKHPNLSDFAKAPSTVTVVIKLKRCVYVSRFQEVFEWHID